MHHIVFIKTSNKSFARKANPKSKRGNMDAIIGIKLLLLMDIPPKNNYTTLYSKV
jgi:hypothetical protein